MTAVRAIAQRALDEAQSIVVESESPDAHRHAVAVLVHALRACVAAAEDEPARCLECERWSASGEACDACADLRWQIAEEDAEEAAVDARAAEARRREEMERERIEHAAYARGHGPEVPEGASTWEREARFAFADDSDAEWAR